VFASRANADADADADAAAATAAALGCVPGAYNRASSSVIRGGGAAPTARANGIPASAVGDTGRSLERERRALVGETGTWF
jgi:hypothetical protein